LVHVMVSSPFVHLGMHEKRNEQETTAKATKIT